MDQANPSLTATATLAEAPNYEHGQQKGRQWARHVARPWQLQRLADAEFSAEEPNWESLLRAYANGSSRGLAVGLYELLHPRAESHGQAVAAFWEGVLGEGGRATSVDADFALGFIQGTVESWQALKSG